MALFTFDDLEFMENKGRKLFGRNSEEDHAPSSATLSTILGYSKALSVRPSDSIGQIRTILN